MGTLVYNGYNVINHEQVHRIKCTKCGKRFGNDVAMWNLLEYQHTIKKIIYEFFFFKNPLKGVAIKRGIPPEMLSRFKKSFVSQVYQQNKEIIEHRQKPFARGIMFADETSASASITTFCRSFSSLSVRNSLIWCSISIWWENLTKA
ncbi:MAG: hypothetical protein GF383_06790 [Candidatus Lokiarchaeota archaeon]|nr:hypothetical protein [Candidatus Lokiarchaeota archaeon]MBD3339828.1 hypothetical protein [Candidatus Lokiarchaeota archaeon]